MKFHTKIQDCLGRKRFRKSLFPACVTALLLASGAAMALPMYTITDLGDRSGMSVYSFATAANYSGALAGLRIGIAMTGAGATVVQSVAQNAAAAAPRHGLDLIKLTTGIVSTGLTLQTAFDAALGTATVAGLTAGAEIFGSFYDTTNSRAWIVLINPGDADTVVGVEDVVTLIGNINMSAADYAAFGAMTDLGDLPGGSDFSAATGVNGSGQVVGLSAAATGLRAFLWQDGVMTDLGDLPGGIDQSFAHGINGSGQVVGESSAATGDRAFLWQNGVGMLDLNDLLIGADGWTLETANDINEAGQIAGFGNLNGHLRGFLLTPVDAGPPPVNAAAPNTTELARLALHVYPDSRQSDIGDFESLGVIPGAEADVNLPFAEAFVRRGVNGGQDQIVISVRGTETLNDFLRDAGFSGLPLERFEEALLAVAEFAGGIREQNPHADFTFTGHSLGAGIATILATEAGIDAVTFNGPGTRNVTSGEYRETLAQIMGDLPSSADDVINYRHYGDQVSLIGLPEGGINTVHDDALTQLLTNAAILCYPCHKMGNLLDLLVSGATITPGFDAPVIHAAVAFPLAGALEGARKLFNVGADQDIFQLFDPALSGDVIEIDLGLSDVMINGILVGGLPGDEFPLLAFDDDIWFEIGILYPYVPMDVASYQKYRILNASDLVDDFGNYIVGLRFNRDGTFRGSLGAPESTQPVPEPGTLLLLGAGLLTLTRLRTAASGRTRKMAA